MKLPSQLTRKSLFFLSGHVSDLHHLCDEFSRRAEYNRLKKLQHEQSVLGSPSPSLFRGVSPLIFFSLCPDQELEFSELLGLATATLTSAEESQETEMMAASELGSVSHAPTQNQAPSLPTRLCFPAERDSSDTDR